MSDINTILNACELVWRQQSVTTTSISDMRRELESHLIEAQSAGKTPEMVVGGSVEGFARTWAGAQGTKLIPQSLGEVHADRASKAEKARMRLYLSMAAMVLVTLIGLLFGPKSDFAGLEGWQWTFVIATFVLLIGEMFTGGFFVLPFGIGAAATCLLAFAEVEPPVLLSTFIVVSMLGLWGLREFASKDDDVLVPVGANRYVDQTAVMTEPINGVGTVGRLRIGTESWMAINDANQFIPAGVVVRISEVRGTRFVVSLVN